MKLSLPRLDASPDPAVEIRPVYVEEWLESLAYANPPTLLDQTLQALERLNRQPLKPSLRLGLLDLYMRPYAFALDFRRTQKPARTGIALARQRDVSARLRRTALAMALGYKQALSDLRARRSRFGGTRDTRLALQRSVLFSSLGLMHAYDEYQPAPQGLWLETMALYMSAAEDGLDGQPVPSKLPDGAFSRSTADCFKCLCLTSLVDPYHLGYGELWAVYSAFGEYAEIARVEPVQEVPRPAGWFVIDPTSDGRPKPLVQVTGMPGGHCRLLDANPVLKALHQRHRRADPADAVPGHTLAAMVRAVGLPPKRHTPRESSDGRVKLAAGLSTLHYFLRGGDTDVTPSVTDAEEIVASDAIGITSGGSSTAYRHQSWQVVNEGADGVGIAHDGRPDSFVGVGDLVGLQFPLRGDDEDDWSLGVIRWISVDEENRHQAGIQMLAERCSPVTVQAESGTGSMTRIPRPALALPSVGTDASSTLITPGGMFNAGDQMRVEAGTRQWLLEATAINESTGTYDRFSYRVLEGD